MATIQGVYVALFGRPADPAGLAYFNGVSNNGANLSSIASLAGTQEYKDRFAGQNNTTIVNSIYQSLFGRDAEAAGLNFFVDALNKGTLNINNIAIAILDGAQGNDKTISSNKIAAADLYTKALDTAPEIGSYQGNAAAAQGRAFITNVTTTVPTAGAVDAAVASMVSAGAAGNTITLQAATSEVLSLTKAVGATPAEAKTTTNNNDTINAAVGTWDPTTDKIDGGLGVDTLNATINGLTATVAGPPIVPGTGNVAVDALKNVEILNLTTVTAGSAVDVANAKELTQVWHVGVSDTAPAAAEKNLTVTGIAATTTVGVRGDVDAAAVTTFTYADTAGTNIGNIAFDGAKAGSVVIADTETINVTNSGNSTITALTVNAAQTVSVAGSGSLDLGVAGTATTLSSVNASAFTGTLTFDATANNALKTVTGGTGTDKITIDLEHSNDLTINTGAGADIITVNGGGATATKALVLTGGADADQFIFQTVGNVNAAAVAATTNADFVKTLITVSDFDKAADAIKVAVAGGTAGNLRDTIVGPEQTQISAAADLQAATKIAAGYTTLHTASVFQYGADSYIFVNNQDAVAGTPSLDAGDTLIKVTGASVADFTASNLLLS